MDQLETKPELPSLKKYRMETVFPTLIWGILLLPLSYVLVFPGMLIYGLLNSLAGCAGIGVESCTGFATVWVSCAMGTSILVGYYLRPNSLLGALVRALTIAVICLIEPLFLPRQPGTNTDTFLWLVIAGLLPFTGLMAGSIVRLFVGRQLSMNHQKDPSTEDQICIERGQT